MLLAAIAGLAPADASASYPGGNGRIFYATGGDIHSIKPDGTGDINLTNSPNSEGWPAVSPSGTKVAFARDFRIYTMNSDGTGVAPLTSGVGFETEPSWSPDGSQVSFSSTESGLYEIWKINANGTGQTRLTSGNSFQQSFRPAWGPGNKIAYEYNPAFNGQREIITINPDGTGTLNVTNNASFDGFAGWQSDGVKVFFASFRTGNLDIWVQNADGSGGATQLTTDPATDQDPQGSPDGSKVVYEHAGAIWTMNGNGSGKTQLVAAGTQPDWQPLVDVTPPQTSIDSGPANGSVISTATPTFAFSADEPATFECRVDGGAWASCSSPYTTSALADGIHSFDVRATDGSANVDPTPASRTFTVDTVSPDTTITAHPSQFSTDTNPSFSFTGSDPSPPGGPVSFQCRLDGGSWTVCSSGDGFNTPEGSHTFDVRAVDAGGNVDPSPASYSWIVDTTPPNITINAPQNKDRYLLHQGPTPVFDCVDPNAPNNSGIDTCIATPINDENLGPHFFEVTATDNAGNTNSKKVAYSIDPPDYGSFVGQDHPLAYYRMNEALGSSDMLDSSGHGHNGIYQNGIALQRDGATNCERRPHPPRACETAAPAENKAAYFPARDGHGYVNGITAPTTGYTMEAWVKPRDGADMMVMSHGGGGQLFISGGHLAFRQVQDTIYSSGDVTPGVWSHVAATWDGHNTRLYVNGVEVASSSSANKPPSGTSTFYIGYGEMAPWFHGTMDEAAYYDYALSAHRIGDRYKIGTAFDHPSLVAGNSPYNTEGPFTDPGAPKNNGLYAPHKVPKANFSCSDPDDVPGNSDIASCTAKVDGVTITSGQPLPDSLGTHTFVVTAIDKGYDPLNEGQNKYVHTHTYTVEPFSWIYGHDNPIAYYRLGDGSGQPMVDWSGNHRDGEYKNDQDSGPVGIAGDGDRARDFFGAGGYGFVNGIAAPRFQATMEAWVKPLGDYDSNGSEFNGSGLPSGWSSLIWNPGGSVSVGAGQLTIDGARAGTDATYGAGQTLDFQATIPASPFTHVGFGVDYNNPPWAMFSVKGDGELYARTDDGSGLAGHTQETHLPSSLLGSSHHYTVEWTAEGVDYYVDDALVASHDVAFGATEMRPLASEYNAGGPKLVLDWLHLRSHMSRDQSIVGHGDAGEIYIRGGYFHYRRMDTTVDSSVPVKPGHWQQVVGTWDGVDIKIYVDGQLAGTKESTKRPSSVSTFYVGYGELAPWFRGSIDEVAYYGTALPAARVFQHYLADPPPGEQNPSGQTVTGGPSEPGIPTGSAACDAATADLAKAESKRDRAKAKVKRLKQHHASKARQKQAKAKVRQARLDVQQAQAVIDARC